MEKNIPLLHSEILIQSYKHDGSLHRTWNKGFVVESNEERVVLITDRTQVIEADGRRWMTREPAVYFLYYKQWFNVIAMLRKNHIYYYCNLASPCVFDEEALKNIDYDLDVKVHPDYHYQLLDEDEYQQHSASMNYSPEIHTIMDYTLDKLIHMIERKEAPFQEDLVHQYYKKYIIAKNR